MASSCESQDTSEKSTLSPKPQPQPQPQQGINLSDSIKLYTDESDGKYYCIDNILKYRVQICATIEGQLYRIVTTFNGLAMNYLDSSQINIIDIGDNIDDYYVKPQIKDIWKLLTDREFNDDFNIVTN